MSTIFPDNSCFYIWFVENIFLQWEILENLKWLKFHRTERFTIVFTKYDNCASVECNSRGFFSLFAENERSGNLP